MLSVTLKSAITPSFMGLMATMLPGVRPEHLLGFLADGFHFTGVLVDGDDGRLVDDDALALGEDQCIGRAEIDGQIGGKQTEKRAKIHYE